MPRKSESERRQNLIRHFSKREIEAAVLDHLRCYGLDFIKDDDLTTIATILVSDERRRRRQNALSRAIYAANRTTALKIAAE